MMGGGRAQLGVGLKQNIEKAYILKKINNNYSFYVVVNLLKNLLLLLDSHNSLIYM